MRSPHGVAYTKSLGGTFPNEWVQAIASTPFRKFFVRKESSTCERRCGNPESGKIRRWGTSSLLLIKSSRWRHRHFRGRLMDGKSDRLLEDAMIAATARVI
jgi:hypothetical protein